MAEIYFHRFESVALLNQSVVALLKHHFEREYPGGHAVMLSGGRTPLEVYRLLAGESCVASHSLHLFFSDERLAPITSSASNFGNARFLVETLGLEENRVFRVHSELEAEAAAGQYDHALRQFISGGGKITLGLLGLGTDGHTASLFGKADLERGRGHYALTALAPDGINRISVSPDLLCKIEQIIFVVSGPEKKTVAERLVKRPSEVVAGLAVAGVKTKQLWFAE